MSMLRMLNILVYFFGKEYTLKQPTKTCAHSGNHRKKNTKKRIIFKLDMFQKWPITVVCRISALFLKSN